LPARWIGHSSSITTLTLIVADEEAIQLKRERLAIETHEYFWHTCPELTPRWKEAVLRLPPSVLKDLAVELRGLGVVTNRASQELSKAHVGVAAGDVPVEDLLDRALASMERLSEAADTIDAVAGRVAEELRAARPQIPRPEQLSGPALRGSDWPSSRGQTRQQEIQVKLLSTLSDHGGGSI